MARGWWQEATLEGQLDAMRQEGTNPRTTRATGNLARALGTPPARDHAHNYDLGTLALRQHGIRIHPHPKGPLCLHYAEGLPEDPAQAMRALQQALEGTDAQLREYWAPLWTLQSKGPLRQHTRYLLRREEAIQGNARWVGELERCRVRLRACQEGAEGTDKGGGGPTDKTRN